MKWLIDDICDYCHSKGAAFDIQTSIICSTCCEDVFQTDPSTLLKRPFISKAMKKRINEDNEEQQKQYVLHLAQEREELRKLKERNRCATLIQKMGRGYMVRLSSQGRSVRQAIREYRTRKLQEEEDRHSKKLINRLKMNANKYLKTVSQSAKAPQGETIANAQSVDEAIDAQSNLVKGEVNRTSFNEQEVADEAPAWVEYYDEFNSAPYWYNNETGETTWDNPNTLVEWISHYDESSGCYYWEHPETGETIWATI